MAEVLLAQRLSFIRGINEAQLSRGSVALVRMITGANHSYVPDTHEPRVTLHHCSMCALQVLHLFKSGSGESIEDKPGIEHAELPLIPGTSIVVIEGLLDLTQPRVKFGPFIRVITCTLHEPHATKHMFLIERQEGVHHITQALGYADLKGLLSAKGAWDVVSEEILLHERTIGGFKLPQTDILSCGLALDEVQDFFFPTSTAKRTKERYPRKTNFLDQFAFSAT